MPLLAFLVPALMGGLAQVLGSLVGRILLALGLSFVTYTGLNFAISSVEQNVISSFSGLSGDVASLLGYLWVDKAISVVFSAFTAALVIKAGTSGTIKSLVMK